MLGRVSKSPFLLLWIQYSCFSLYPPLYSKRPNIQGDRTNATKVLSDPPKTQGLFQWWLQRKHDSLDPFLLLRMLQSLTDPTTLFPNPGNFKCLDFNSGIGSTDISKLPGLENVLQDISTSGHWIIAQSSHTLNKMLCQGSLNFNMSFHSRFSWQCLPGSSVKQATQEVAHSVAKVSSNVVAVDCTPFRHAYHDWGAQLGN